jgi:hypothetical protein
MKTLKFFAGALATMAIFAACDPTEPTELTGLTLDKTTAQVEIGKTVTLTASTNPAGLTVDMTWESANTAVATVSNGVVTGVAEGTAMIAVSAKGKSATCLVTVKKEGTDPNPGETPASLTGSEYYPILLDGTSFQKIQSKVVADFRPNESEKNLYIWSVGDTYIQGLGGGLNFYGNTEGYVSLTVANVGWSGCGFNVPNAAVATMYNKIKDNLSDYYFHIAIKSTDNASHWFFLLDDKSSSFVLGATAFNDNGTIYPVKTNFTRNGSWQEIEFPLSDLRFTNYNASADKINILSALSGGVAGTQLNVDAIFIYKK